MRATGCEDDVSHNDDISRRDFLVRTGAAGLGLTVLGPGVARALPISTGISGHHMASAADGLAPLFSGLRWRTLGPFRGGRVDAVCGVVGRPNEFYFGHVNGGVWKSIDAGRVWVPIFDSQPVASIGALAVAPSAPDTIYVGSGESTLRDSVGQDLDASRARRHPPHRKDRRRPAKSEHCVRRRDRSSLRA
jgi:hypothetical protein